MHYSILNSQDYKYQIVREKSHQSNIELGTYLKDLFDSNHAELFLNFGYDEIRQLLEK